MHSFVLLLALSGATPGGSVEAAKPALVLDEKREYYELHAATRRELKRKLREALRDEGDGKGGDGRTRQAISSRYELEPTARGCRMKEPEVRLEILVRLPRWVSPEEDPPAKLEEAWAALLAALETHEAGHRELAIEAAEELVDALAGLDGTLSCQELDRLARRALLSATLRHSIRDRAYERRTRNGAAQGVIL